VIFRIQRDSGLRMTLYSENNYQLVRNTVADQLGHPWTAWERSRDDTL